MRDSHIELRNLQWDKLKQPGLSYIIQLNYHIDLHSENKYCPKVNLPMLLF